MKKGGDAADASGRKCLCNGLVASIGLGQARPGGAEPALLTSGDGLFALSGFLAGRSRYSAGDVLDHLMGTGQPAPA